MTAWAYGILFMGTVCFLIAAFSPQPESEQRVTFTPAPRRPRSGWWPRSPRPASPSGAAEKTTPAAPSAFAADAVVATLVRPEERRPARAKREKRAPAAPLPTIEPFTPATADPVTGDPVTTPVDVEPAIVDAPAAAAEDRAPLAGAAEPQAADPSAAWWSDLIDRDPSDAEKVRMITALGAIGEAWSQRMLQRAAAAEARSVPAVRDAIRIAMVAAGDPVSQTEDAASKESSPV
jgi:hypothetical protein